MSDTQVLIVGAGPTGLVLALWLSKLGVRVRIIDRAASPGMTSRALAVQARTLELYRQLDLADSVVRAGLRVPAINLWVKGERKARLDFASIGSDLSPYSFLEIYPQDEHERLLIARLGDFGVVVERQSELLDFSDGGDGIRARLRRASGEEETCEAAFLAGCDGAHSRVREVLASGFPGGTYRQVFYVADMQGSGPPVNGELHVDLDEADFLAVFPLAGEGRARLIGTVCDERAEGSESLRFADVSGRAIEHMQLVVERVNWFSTYHVHHRVAGQFRKGRAFLLGDAAHIHSPAGGQGMNTGIGDAINLAWKLAAVTSRRAPDALLDSYEIERMRFARRLVSTTDRVFTFVTADGPIAELVRTRLAPTVLATATSFAPVREFMFRTVSQITLNYRDAPLSAGSAGGVHGGDRLPWVGSVGVDNYRSLDEPRWQAHVYGGAREALRAACEARGVPLQVFPWQSAYGRAGLARDACYLLRPDSYVALADAAGDAATLERYFAERGMAP